MLLARTTVEAIRTIRERPLVANPSKMYSKCFGPEWAGEFVRARDVGVCLVQWGEEDTFRSHVIFTTHFGYDPTLGAHTKPLPYAKRDARFRKVLGACGMHGAVGAGRRRRRSWMQGHVLPAVIRPRRPRCRSAAPGGHLVAGFAVLRAPGRVAPARARGLAGARPGARRLATCMDDLDGTGQGSP